MANDLAALLKKAVPEGGVTSGDDCSLDIEFLSTGVPPLDMLIGGGLPRKRASLLVGEESAGKSFIAQKFISGALKGGHRAVLVDVERCFDPTWANRLGIDIHNKNFAVAQPASGEAALDVVTEALKDGVDLVVLDSIAMLTPVKLLQAGGEDIFIGLLARLLSPGIMRWQQVNQKSALLLINQIRDVIGTPFHEIRFPGGALQKYASSLTLKVRRRGWLSVGSKRTGFPIVFTVIKTKIPGVTPFSTCEVPFLFDGSLKEIESLVKLAIDKGIIRQDKAHYYVGIPGDPEPLKIFGAGNVVKLFEENPDLVKILVAVQEDEIVRIEDSPQDLSV